MKKFEKSSKLSRKLAAILSCVCLLAVLMAGCGDEGEASHGKKSSEDVKESSSQEVESTETGETPGGNDQTVTTLSTEELYQGFIDGLVRVYCDNQDYTFYDSVADEEYKMFGNKEGYTLKEMVGVIQGILDVTPDITARVGNVYYATIDCGRDGEPELLVEIYNEGDLWGTENLYQFIIKNVNGKLQICNKLTETYNDECYVNTKTGLAQKNYYYGMGSQNGVGYLDANCEYHFLYSYDITYNYGESNDPIYSALADIAKREGNEAMFDCFDVLQYRFSEYQDNEDEKQVLKSTYYYYGGEEYDAEPDAETKALLEEAFAKAGYQLYTKEEINGMIDARLKEFGFPKQEQIYEDYIEWETVEKEGFWPGEVVTVKDADEFMKAIGSNKIIYLEPGTYDLTKWLQGTGFNGVPQYLFGDYSSENSVGVSYTGYDDSSWEIHVCFIENMTIASKNPSKPAQIVCDCPSALVMEFDQCAFIELQDLVMGHEVEPGYCTGDVVGFDESSYCTLTKCDLYGCGAYGADFYNCDSASVQDCVIHDCTYGCMNIVNSGYLYVENCKFENCKEFTMFEIYDTGVSFYNCTFRNLEGNLVSNSESAYVSFSDCVFDENALKSIQNHPLYEENIWIY